MLSSIDSLCSSNSTAAQYMMLFLVSLTLQRGDALSLPLSLVAICIEATTDRAHIEAASRLPVTN
jgi:hypothetical protein